MEPRVPKWLDRSFTFSPVRNFFGAYYKVASGAWSLPDGKHNFAGHTVVKDKKMVIFAPTALKRATRLVAFPAPEHFEVLKDAAKLLREGGPAELNPGALGTVELHCPIERKIALLSFAQSHYSSKVMSRKWISRYGGWRTRALKLAIEMAHRENRTLIIREGRKVRLTPKLITDLERACEALGVTLIRGFAEMRIPPKSLTS